MSKKEYTEEMVRLIIEGAIQEEREACAVLCKDLAQWHSEIVTAAYENAADAIRARSNHETILPGGGSGGEPTIDGIPLSKIAFPKE